MASIFKIVKYDLNFDELGMAMHISCLPER